MRSRAGSASLSVLAIAALASLFLACGGIPRVSKDGYRAVVLFSPTLKYEIAVRGEWRRVQGDVDGAPLVKIYRPDLKKTWQFRPVSKRLLEQAWAPTDEIIPGYPLEPHFDPQAYASRFRGQIHKIADAALAGHPCDRYQMDLPTGDRVTIWVARDYEGLAIRIERRRKHSEGEGPAASDVRLTDIRVGAEKELFEKPKGYTPVASYQELRKGP
jgi:hypothetical protein